MQQLQRRKCANAGADSNTTQLELKHRPGIIRFDTTGAAIPDEPTCSAVPTLLIFVSWMLPSSEITNTPYFAVAPASGVLLEALLSLFVSELGCSPRRRLS